MADRPGARDEAGRAGALFPVNLVLEGRRCLVVGGGAVAAQKIRGLIEAGAEVDVVAPELSEAVRAIPGLTSDERPYRSGDVAGYWLVIAATNDSAVNRSVFADGEKHRVWVNSADDPANCSALLPSRIRRGPLLVTFSTSGEAPAVAKWLRTAYEPEFGDEHVTLIELVAEERRRIQAEGRSTDGMSWQTALDSGTLDLIREGHLAEAKERLQACLSSSSD
ncbi:MAG: bifunctional precorrin-2 dehydrogenase/sirohydrochlorin ferrochelatase [Actinobacteria bacterium]|nr:bifunctional precorrin-2 dehydrogenase/sirohydrochlorin ferrochelatase [Actinomycetota bacterium]